MEGLNFFDAILYINLAHRRDRKKRLLQELKRLKTDRKKIHRIEGFYDPCNGHRGCAESHKNALTLSQSKGWDKILILEDDCIFASISEVEKAVEALKELREDWDVFLLGGDLAVTTKTSFPHVLKVNNSLRTHAYAIRKTYLSSLCKAYEESLHLMEDKLFFFDALEVAIDRRWQLLQKEDRWFTCEKQVAFQGESFSDICCLHLMQR